MITRDGFYTEILGFYCFLFFSEDRFTALQPTTTTKNNSTIFNSLDADDLLLDMHNHQC